MFALKLVRPNKFCLAKVIDSFVGRHFISHSVRLKTSDNLIWPVQQTYMTTCQELWQDRPMGASFYVGFVDTGRAKDKKNTKNVLLLMNEHSIDDDDVLERLQNNIVMPLFKENCRVLMPCLVGSKYTEGHSSSDNNCFEYQLLGERSRFILDFIANRKMEKIDLIIGHSMASFPAIALASNCDLFKRLAIISPIPGNKPPSWILPLKRSLFTINSYMHPLLRPLGRLLLKRSRRKMKGLLHKNTTDEQVLHLAKVSHGINFNMVSNIVTSLSFRKIPFISITSDDTISHGDDNDEYLEMFGLSKHDVQLYDQSSTSQSLPPIQTLTRGAHLQCSTHYPFLDDKWSKIIVDELLNLFKMQN